MGEKCSVLDWLGGSLKDKFIPWLHDNAHKILNEFSEPFQATFGKVHGERTDGSDYSADLVVFFDQIDDGSGSDDSESDEDESYTVIMSLKHLTCTRRRSRGAKSVRLVSALPILQEESPGKRPPECTS